MLDLFAELGRLHAVLLSAARRHRHVLMPVYTHFQAAMPVTYGYYLVGVAHALGRDLSALRHAVTGLDRSPLGAGAVAGTNLPIRPARTAKLLGFEEPPAHAIDAVASRDVPLRVLAAAAGAALTIGRLGTDLQLWSTVEFDFVRFPEHLVGGSSAMPQKRNAFLLEHIKAAAGLAIGAWTAAATTVKSTPFTNSIEVGTEAVAAVWPGLRAVADATLLAQVTVSGARPVPERMAERAEQGFVTATALANELVAAGVPFRAAHHRVGAAVRAAVEAGSTEPTGLAVPAPSLAEAVGACDRGGGPGAFGTTWTLAVDQARDHGAWHRGLRHRQAAADNALRVAVERIGNGVVGA